MQILNYSLKIILILTFTFLFTSQPGVKPKAFIEFSFASDKELFVGEELTYAASYSFIKLGEVRLSVKDKKNIGGRTIYSTIAYIDSYPGLPFVNIHQTYESSVSSKQYSEFFRGIMREEEPYTYTDYYFDYNKKQIRVKKGRFNPAKVWTDSITSADTYYQDGLSIFYYARMNSGSGKSVDIPCFVSEKKVSTKINFYNEVTDVSIDAVDYDIECMRLDGETNFISIFGLTGYFEGWFTNDEASIPVVAKMNVIIGNIKLELVKWKREGWMPPRFVKG
jgi:hypothetical protein